MRRHCGTSLLLALLLSGCTAGEVELYEPEGSGLGQGLTVKVELEATAAEFGEALGWRDGVPGAEVRVHRIATDFSWQTALTDSEGVARFPDLLVGSYRVAANRVLTDEEVEQVSGRRRAFGDGKLIEVRGPRTLTLTLAPDQRGSLLIGEIYGLEGFFPPGRITGVYRYHDYLEIYNNSDTTIYLDGKILGLAYNVSRAHSSWSCDQSAPFRNDPDGVWARWFHQFPGSGTDHPLAPGEIAVVARDAIDHSQIYAGFPDLTRADFEVLGPTDVDNPAVPNLPEIGLASFWWGHGLELWARQPYFLSEPVDLETLPRMRHPGGTYEYVRFPGEALLDVVAAEAFSLWSDQNYPPCPGGMVHRDFDRMAGGFVTLVWDLEYSAQRIVLDVTPDGRAILQDTNTSAVDLIRALYTVGTLPPQTP